MGNQSFNTFQSPHSTLMAFPAPDMIPFLPDKIVVNIWLECCGDSQPANLSCSIAHIVHWCLLRSVLLALQSFTVVQSNANSSSLSITVTTFSGSMAEACTGSAIWLEIGTVEIVASTGACSSMWLPEDAEVCTIGLARIVTNPQGYLTKFKFPF